MLCVGEEGQPKSDVTGEHPSNVDVFSAMVQKIDSLQD